MFLTVSRNGHVMVLNFFPSSKAINRLQVTLSASGDDEYLCTARLFQLTGSSFTPDNRFIVSLNDKPVNGHKHSVHKYSSHENSNEIDHEKQNKSRVQKKSTATETRPSLSPLI